MDIQKEIFEREFSKTNFYKRMLESLKNEDCPFKSVFEMRNGKYRSTYVDLSFEIWQAAQAVPEGFVLVPKEPTQRLYRTFYDAFNSANAGNTAQCFKVAYKAMIEAQEQGND